MRYFIHSILFLCILIVHQESHAQGCVAIRGSGASACMATHDANSSEQKWTLNTGLRYFKSFRHFSGKEEHKERLVENTEVINYTTAIDFALTRTINPRWSIMVDLPIMNNARSSLYEHGLVNGVYIKRER